ncbi:unnamed protein product [Rhodiola kirilowii]
MGKLELDKHLRWQNHNRGTSSFVPQSYLRTRSFRQRYPGFVNLGALYTDIK